jgi:hypothetical protein
LKKYFLLWSLLLLSLPAVALSGQHVQYVGGTAPGIKNGAIGKLDTTSDSSLIFEYQGTQLSVPYADIDSFQHTKEVARHLGVLPVIVVTLLKPRQQRHFFRVAYHDPNSPNPVMHVIVLEVPKRMSCTLEAVLDARAPQRGRSCNYWGCWR